MLVNNERPGVYSSISVSGALKGTGTGRSVGVAAIALSGEKGRCYRIDSYGEAVSQFGSGSSLTELIRILVTNGASDIRAVPVAVNTAATAADYQAAFGVLMTLPEVSLMVCDSGDTQVHNGMRIAIAGGAEVCKHRIGIVETGGTTDEASQRALALNCERMVLLHAPQGCAQQNRGQLSAAFAGILAIGGDPALPLNGAELLETGMTAGVFSDTEINTLVRGGVTPIEVSGGRATVIRAVTTKTQTGGAADATWRELSTVLIVDDVIPAIRSELKLRFPRVKNTAQTRGAIRTQVIIQLEEKLKRQIIDGYGSVTAQADADDPTVCRVSFEFSVAHGLNRIYLSANINV